MVPTVSNFSNRTRKNAKETNGPIFTLELLSAAEQRGRERKGPPEIIKKFRLRNWPISSADFPSRLLWKGQSTILALFRTRILGQ